MKLQHLKFSNFRITGKGEGYTFAKVTVTTVERGFWWWQKKESSCVREVARKSDYWYFTDTGRYCPGDSVDRLAREYDAWRPT